MFAYADAVHNSPPCLLKHELMVRAFRNHGFRIFARSGIRMLLRIGFIRRVAPRPDGVGY